MGKTIATRQLLLTLAFVTAIILAGLPTTGNSAQTVFFTENFDDADFASRGWYDGTAGNIDTNVYSPAGGNSSLRISWAQGDTVATAPRRFLFTASETVYISFWMKLGTAGVTWRGSDKSYHPHMMHLLTDWNGPFDGLAWDYLTFYIEWSLFTPRIAIQDGQRINLGALGTDLLGTATWHAVAGGNGSQTQANPDVVDYYPIGGGDYTNATFFDSASANFVNNRWHHVEVYVAMNSISGGLPQANGIIKFWVDGNLVIDKTNVYLRTAPQATQQFNQFVLAPWIGDGSPIAQDMWIDNLLVADQRGETISAPTNLRIIP